MELRLDASMCYSAEYSTGDMLNYLTEFVTFLKGNVLYL